MSKLAGPVLRIASAAVLLAACVPAATSPLVPWWVNAAALLTLGVSLGQPQWGLILAIAIAPWGARLADVPIRATEYVCVAFLVGWLVRLDRPLRLSASGRAALMPALAYGGLAALSWFRVSLATPTARLPYDYLITAGRDPHTAAMLQILLGIALVFATASLLVQDARTGPRVIGTVAGVALIAAVATVAAVPLRYWATGDTNELIRYFVVTRSRYAFHVPDVNAAGSHFILGGILALSVLGASLARRVWRAVGVVVTLAALWICGSRAAMTAGIALGAYYFQGWRLVRWGWRWPATTTGRTGAFAVAALVLLAVSPTVVGSTTAMSGSASRSMSVREEFLVTSVRMASTAPVLGVGVGTYYQRSGEFMPPGIRALYGRENAHDYFMQTLAELGIVGVIAFVWWLGASLRPMWQAIDRDGRPTATLAILLACVGFLLTCVTGHPLLVVEVSVPFWATLGVAASGRT